MITLQYKIHVLVSQYFLTKGKKYYVFADFAMPTTCKVLCPNMIKFGILKFVVGCGMAFYNFMFT